MPVPVEAVTTRLLSLALQAATQRHAALAANVANAHAPAHVPLALSFESQLAGARASLAERGAVDPATLDGMRPELEPQVDADGLLQPVQLDLELAAMARNAVHHHALAQGLARHLSVMALAVSEGRR